MWDSLFHLIDEKSVGKTFVFAKKVITLQPDGYYGRL